MYRLPSLTLFVLGTALLAGCGGDQAPAYTKVSGTVSLNGKPLPKGIISFSTDGRPPSTMDIVDGQYTGQAMVGTNTVSISSRRKASGTAAGGKVDPGAQARMEGYKRMMEQKGGGSADESPVGMEEIIPAEYNIKSKHTRVVEPGGENKFDFLIKSDKQ